MIQQINWQKCNNLIPVIIQDIKTFDVLMLGFMNQEALKNTQETQKVHFFSRTKNRIWMKGEESGNILNVIQIKLDCDNDSLLILVNPVGITCHNGTKSCFNYDVNFLSKLEKISDDRIINLNSDSYIQKLVTQGINKVVQKVGEEATEVVISALTESKELLLEESADLLFHLMIILRMKNLNLSDIIEILDKRNKVLLKNE